MINETERSITLKIPKLSVSLQSGILIMLIIVALLQTVQLYGLDRKIASAQAPAASTAVTPASASGSGSVTSALPEMVGGC